MIKIRKCLFSLLYHWKCNDFFLLLANYNIEKGASHKFFTFETGSSQFIN